MPLSCELFNPYNLVSARPSPHKASLPWWESSWMPNCWTQKWNPSRSCWYHSPSLRLLHQALLPWDKERNVRANRYWPKHRSHFGSCQRHHDTEGKENIWYTSGSWPGWTSHTPTPGAIPAWPEHELKVARLERQLAGSDTSETTSVTHWITTTTVLLKTFLRTMTMLQRALPSAQSVYKCKGRRLF